MATTNQKFKVSILNASAGSGKTYRLAYRYVRDIIENPHLYRNILAVTFTNKATEEMKSRILSHINLLASNDKSPYLEDLMQELSLSEEAVRSQARIARSNILHDYSRFTVVTIDRFFQRIIRGFIQELGIDISYNLEIETADVLEQSTDYIIERIADKNEQELHKWILEFVDEQLQDGKKWDVRDTIKMLGNEVFRESTQELIKNALPKSELKKIVHKWIEAKNSAKEELVSHAKRAMSIINSCGLSANDFPYKKSSFAQWFHNTANGLIVEPGARVAGKLDSIDGWIKSNQISNEQLEELRTILNTMHNLYYESRKTFTTASLIAENYRSYALLNDIYNGVDEICKERGVMLLSQTKGMLSKFIADNDAPFIYEKIGNRFERFLLDEFQDTSRMEWCNLLPLLSNATSSVEGNSVFIVGDIKQSIYRWRGGDWRILHNDAKELLGEEITEVKNLQENYRSGKSIVEFVNHSIGDIVRSINGSLNLFVSDAHHEDKITDKLAAELNDMTSHAYTSHTQSAQRKRDGFVEVCQYSQESPYLESIKEALDLGYRPCDIMILVRNKDEGVKVAEALLQFKSENRQKEYNFDVMTQEALVIGNAPICRFIIALFALSVDPTDTVELAIYNRFLGSEYISKPLDTEVIKTLSDIRQLSIVEAFDKLVITFNLDSYTSQIAFLQAIHEQIITYACNRVGDIALFIKWWGEQGASKSLSVEQSESAIEITTIHKAKGLQKEIIILPFCSWDLKPKAKGTIWAHEQELGYFPIKVKEDICNSYMASEYIEEMVYSHIDAINILYVALTRAVSGLYIFISAKDKRIGGALLSSIESVKTEFEQMDIPTSERSENENLYTLFSTKIEAESASESGESYNVVKMSEYPTRPSSLKIKLPSQRYLDDNDGQLSPRDNGILLHSIFEKITERNELEDVVKEQVKMGLLKASEGDEVCEKFNSAMQNPTIREWFEPHWDNIFIEQAILLPGNRHIKRPDRVMVKGDRAVVVDYKFGVQHTKSNKRQVAQYMEHLTRMGYKNVEGWLWHIKEGDIEQIKD